MKQSYSASLFSFLSAIPSFPPHPNRDRALRKVNPPRGQTSQTLDQKFRSGHVYANSLFPVRETVECLLNASTEAVNLVSESRFGNLGYTLDRFNFRFSSPRFGRWRVRGRGWSECFVENKMCRNLVLNIIEKKWFFNWNWFFMKSSKFENTID